MKQNLKKIIPVIFFIIIFSIFYGPEYINFHKQKQELLKNNNKISKQIQEFNFNKINYLNNVEIFYGPENNILEKIIEEINGAKEKIYLEVYMLTETRIQNALIKAKIDKNLDIKIILEKNPYMSTNINNKAYDNLSKNNINIIWSNPENYSLNHSKLLLIDDKAIISTGNFTYSSFKYNREFFVFIQDKQISKSLNKIFYNDYNYIKDIIYEENLVISPNYSREKIEYLLNNAKKNISMYFPYIEDKNLENILIKKIKSGIKISLIVDKIIEENQSYKNLLNAGIQIKKLQENKLHAKAILIDNTYLYIGSINFSTYSLDKNREIGILIKIQI